jgi:hypothetical protein
VSVGYWGGVANLVLVNSLYAVAAATGGAPPWWGRSVIASPTVRSEYAGAVSVSIGRGLPGAAVQRSAITHGRAKRRKSHHWKKALFTLVAGNIAPSISSFAEVDHPCLAMRLKPPETRRELTLTRWT